VSPGLITASSFIRRPYGFAVAGPSIARDDQWWRVMSDAVSSNKTQSLNQLNRRPGLTSVFVVDQERRSRIFKIFEYTSVEISSVQVKTHLADDNT
jgi:hypothetical protein